MKRTRKGSGVSRLRRPGLYLQRHAQVLISSLGRLARAPLATLLTTSVIAIALALPTGLYLGLDNLQRATGSWDNDAGLSLFLKPEVDDRQAAALAERLRERPDVDQVRLITRAQALEEFRQYSGFADALSVLEQNPLPAVITLHPTDSDPSSETLEALRQELSEIDAVELVQLDLQWLRRLQALTAVVQRGVLVIALLLGLGVLLTIGNTIRLEIQNRADEIVITKLVGATDAFVRRPFLYAGLWLGLLGALPAWLLVTLALLSLDPAISRLTLLYQSDFHLLGLSWQDTLALLGGGALLGLAGAWLAVARHLKQIEPS